MPRPQKHRRICQKPAVCAFSPENTPDADCIVLTLDEFEAIRLVDTERLTHEQCAARMDISRSTVTEIYESARSKVAQCIVFGKRLVIAGGNYRLCDGSAKGCHRRGCHLTPSHTPAAGQHYQKEGSSSMKIAVTYQNGTIFQHFGHTEQFKVYEVENGAIVNSRIVDTNGSGHGALAGFLLANGVNVLICGGIGPGAQNALAQAGIKLYGGASGDADSAVQALLNSSLDYNPNVRCDHHDHGHDHGHHCGEHGCHDHGHDHHCGEHGCH